MALAGGSIFSWFTPDGEPGALDGDGIRFNIKYGLHIDFMMGSNENYFFSTGLFMANTGGSLLHDFAERRTDDANLEVVRRSVDYRINYLNIPLNFKLMTNEVGYSRYFARVGFDLGLAVNSRYDSRDRLKADLTDIVRERENADSGDFTRFWRAALHIEAGMEYNIGGNTNLFASLEWNNGLNNVFTNQYRRPTVNEQDGVRINGDRHHAVINYVAVNVGIYF